MPSIRSASDSESSPSSPIRSHPTRRDAATRRGMVTRSSLDRHSKNDIASLLFREERDGNNLRKMLFAVTEQLKEESKRADDNERRARAALARFKEVNEARILAEQDAARAHEELRMYKYQLENAQHEVDKAQAILDSLEQDRYEAESSAARARSTARQIKEEIVIERAREEGRRLGLQQRTGGGRRFGPTVRPPMDAYVRDRDRDDSDDEDLALGYPATPAQRPAAPAAPVPPPAPPILTAPPTVRSPSAVFNPPLPSSPHPSISIPLDGFIPLAGPDQSILLPPPHDLQRIVPTPETSLAPLPADEVPLMVPNPSVRRDNGGYAESVASRQSHQYHHRRPSSPESMGSTNLSHFELLSEPASRPNSTRMKRRSLSVIPEVLSSETTPANHPNGLAGDMPSTRFSNRSYDNVNTPPVIPAPHMARADIPALQEEAKHVYRRPSFASASTSSMEDSAMRTPMGSERRSLKERASFSSSVPDITIQPPSRPPSSTHTQLATPATATREFLSVDDAHRPVTPTAPTEPALTPKTVPSTTPSSAPIVLTGDLPPGFIPIGPAIPASPRSSGNLPVYPSPVAPALDSRVPRVPDSTSSTSRKAKRDGLPVAVPLPSSASRTSRSSGVIPGPNLRGLATSSSSDSDDAVSSSLASTNDTLSTPPPSARKKKLAKKPTYDAAPVDDGFLYPSTPLARTITPGGSSSRAPLPSVSPRIQQAGLPTAPAAVVLNADTEVRVPQQGKKGKKGKR